MSIEEPLQLITVQEFKSWKGFNTLLFDDITTPEHEIWYAISIASSNINYLSGFNISLKWPEIPETDWTDNLKTATAHYVRFLLTKDTDYLRGQSSISQAGLTYSQNNPEDPYFIPPEVFNFLRKSNEYNNTIKGYNLANIAPQSSHFNTFINNIKEDSPFNNYIPYHNLISLDPRTKITITHPKNMLQSILNIDTRDIKDITNRDIKDITNNITNNITPSLIKHIFDSNYFTITNNDNDNQQQLTLKTNDNQSLTQDLLVNNEYKSLEVWEKKAGDPPLTNINLETFINAPINSIFKSDSDNIIIKKESFNSWKDATDNKKIVTDEYMFKSFEVNNVKLEYYFKLTYFSKNALQTTNKNIIGSINELDTRINELDTRINELDTRIIKPQIWKAVGSLLNDKLTYNHNFKLYQRYRIGFWIANTNMQDVFNTEPALYLTFQYRGNFENFFFKLTSTTMKFKTTELRHTVFAFVSLEELQE